MAKPRTPIHRMNQIDKDAVSHALADIDPAERADWLVRVELRALERGDQALLDAIDDWRLEQRFKLPAALN